MSASAPEPAAADVAPWAETLTEYDLAHLVLYLRLLDADRDGADWREAVRILLDRDPDTPEARTCWASHLRRAEWMTTNGYRLLAAQNPFDQNAST